MLLQVLFHTDIEQDAYYYDALVWGYSNGIVLGTTETTFSPDENVTRAQVIAFLYRLAGEPESGAKVPFTDVPSVLFKTPDGSTVNFAHVGG